MMEIRTHWSGTTWSAKHVAQQGGVTRLLISHELHQKHVGLGQVQSRKVRLIEFGHDVAKEIQLNPLLVKTQENRLVVEVGLNTVDWLCAVGSQAASWLEWYWLLHLQSTVWLV